MNKKGNRFYKFPKSSMNKFNTPVLSENKEFPLERKLVFNEWDNKSTDED